MRIAVPDAVQINGKRLSELSPEEWKLMGQWHQKLHELCEIGAKLGVPDDEDILTTIENSFRITDSMEEASPDVRRFIRGDA